MRAIVTVIGKDKPGITARVATELADKKVNIEDISQTIVQGNFTMIMLCDFSASSVSLIELREIMAKTGEEIGVSIHVQHEDIFNAMHKI